jgi:hypothetical protein
MSNLITDTRAAIQAYLATPFPPPIEIREGRFDGVNRDDFAKIHVWHPGVQTIPGGDRTLARPTLMLRYFPTLSKQPEAALPRSQDVLEQAEVDLLTAFAGKNRAGDFVANVAVSVAAAVLNDDPARWFVELTLSLLTLNPAMPAA